MTKPYAPRTSSEDIEKGGVFRPKFDSGGLIPAIITDVSSGNVLMFAFMNATALSMTLETGVAHFWSRSRNTLWKKGEESGNLLAVEEIRTDCDQDVVWVTARVAGDGVACHTGAKSCFYRRLEGTPNAEGGVRLIDAALPDSALPDAAPRDSRSKA